ncbi:UNVERIFIED_ORG: vanillate O-demethylase monooxygenase subunit [Paraburkholderia sediminicola]|nr:vanillate O-demethylase monooxygenase subunit [Paraburkholderia sediminicola]
MYPLKKDMNFPKNQWYVAAWSDQIGPDLLARTILGMPVVLYRTREGNPVALADRCPHRRYPLSRGKLIDDQIECGYHGFTFDCSGKCVRIPSQTDIPASYGVTKYPLVQRWEWLWIWMGDPSLADESLIPDHGPLRVSDEGWQPTVGAHERVESRYIFLHDNLLDLSHLSYLHGSTIGGPGIAHAEAEMKQDERQFIVSRFIKSDQVEHLPLAKTMNMTGLVDRTMIQYFFPPGLHSTGSSFQSAVNGGVEPGKPYGALRVNHAITPETENTTHYFWAFSRNFGLGDQQLTESLKADIAAALDEDVVGVKYCEAMVSLGGLGPEIHARSDAPGLRGRRLLEQQIELEMDIGAGLSK